MIVIPGLVSHGCGSHPVLPALLLGLPHPPSTSRLAAVPAPVTLVLNQPATATTRHTSQEFELTINVDRLVKDADRDFNGFLSYDEFRTLLS